MHEKPSYEQLKKRVLELEQTELEQKKALDREAHIKQVLLAIRRVDPIIVEENEEHSLIQRVCARLTATPGYYNAWIALLDEEEASVTITAAAGFENGFGLMRDRLLKGPSPTCMQRALMREDVQVTTDPATECFDCPLAGAYAGRAGLTRRLGGGDRVRGVLSVSVPKAYAYDKEALELLDNLTASLSFALRKIEAEKHNLQLNSQRREAEAALKENKERMSNALAFNQGILNTSSIGILVYDATGQCTFANEAAAQLAGIQVPDLLKQNFHRLASWKASGLYDTACRALKTRSEQKIETHMTSSSGKDVWLSVRLSTFQSRQKPWLLVFIKDISQRRIAQESLQQLSEQSRTVSWTVDTQGLFTSVSDVAKTVWGYEPEELAGKKHFYELCPEAERNAFKNTIARACTRQAPFMNIENRVQTKSGEILWMNTNGIPFFNDEGRLMGYRGRDSDITERKRSEKAIREREQFLSTLLETTVDGFWVVDPNGRIIEANQAISKMTGYAHEELLGAHIKAIDALETPEETDERMQRIIDNGYEIFETRLRCKDRQLLPVEISSTYLDLEGGRFVCFCRDLTAHKKAEAALIESEAQVRRKLQALIDPDEAISELSLADIVATDEIRALMEDLYQLTGIGIGVVDQSGKVLVAIGWQDICSKFHRVHPEASSYCEESDTQLTRGLEPGAFKSYKCKNSMWDIATPIIIGGRHVGNVFLGQFFYEDEQPDYELFRNQARHYGFDEAAYIQALDRVPRWPRETVQTAMRFYAGFAAFVSGLSYGNLELARALEERNRIQQEQERLQEQLLQAQKMESVGRLAGGVAHDYNNILSVIQGYTELAMEKLAPEDEIRQDLEEVMTAARRSADITRQLLAFSRQQTIAPQALDLNETVESMLKMLQRLLGEDIKLAWHPKEGAGMVYMDATQVDQILVNLCVNARDAIRDVGRITIETDAAAFDQAELDPRLDLVPSNYVMLAVSDDGKGMDSKTLKYIFEPFFSTKEQGKGTGLGLATVYGIVRQNEGDILVDSEPGRGTTFRIYLPRHDAAAAPGEKDRPEAEEERGKETLLLVEDDPKILKMANMMLRRLGYTVLAAGTPGEAFDLIDNCPAAIHLLITDVVLPEMNGRELATRLKSRYPGLRVLFMSGYPADVIAHRGVLESGVDFIQKPFSKKELASRVRRVMEKCTVGKKNRAAAGRSTLERDQPYDTEY